MIEQGLATTGEKAVKAAMAPAAKAASTTGGKTLAAKALAFVPGIPILAVGGLVGIIAWEFWKGSRDAKEMK